MRNAQKPDHISLDTLISRLREGRFVIPDFQREFEWQPWDVRDLMRSIFLDYYIGSLLLWKGEQKNFAALSCESIDGFQGSANPEYIVLDGQQRLTAMYYAFHSPDKPFPTRKNRYYFYIQIDNFLNEEYDNAFFYDWTRKWEHFINDKKQQYETHKFPLSVIGEKGFALPNWLQGYVNYWEEKTGESQQKGKDDHVQQVIRNAKNAKKFSEYLEALTRDYQISYIELTEQIEIDKVCDIFTHINSKGVQLDTFDLINALLKPKGIQLKRMWRDAAPRLEFVDSKKMNVYVLQVMSILKQSYCSPKYLYHLLPGQEKSVRDPDGTSRKEILNRDIDEFKKCWEDAVNVLEQAIKSLRHPQEFGAISSRYIPYVSIIPVYSAIQEYVNKLSPDRKLVAQTKIRYWYWASIFLNRYSGSVESTSARDFMDLKKWIEDDFKKPSIIQEFGMQCSNLDFRQEQRRGTSIYNGVFNLLIIRGARDWITGKLPQHDDLDDHHIIPKSKENELKTDGLIHSILNRTPLTAETNRNVIRNRYPYEYLPEWINKSGEQIVCSVLETHFISRNCFEILLRTPFTLQDFEEFIEERQQTLKKAIQNLLASKDSVFIDTFV